MGASEGLVLRFVLVQGILVALAGIGFGLLLGLLLANHVTETVSLLESLIGARLLDGSYFDTVPSVVLPCGHRTDRGGVVRILLAVGTASGSSCRRVEPGGSVARGVVRRSLSNVPAMAHSRLHGLSVRVNDRAIAGPRACASRLGRVRARVMPLTHTANQRTQQQWPPDPVEFLDEPLEVDGHFDRHRRRIEQPRAELVREVEQRTHRQRIVDPYQANRERQVAAQALSPSPPRSACASERQ